MADTLSDNARGFVAVLKLQAEIAALRAEVTRLTASRDALAAALRPFAEVGQSPQWQVPQATADKSPSRPAEVQIVQTTDCVAAAAALAEHGPGLT